MTYVPPLESSDIAVDWRGTLVNSEVDNLHAECFAHPPGSCDWRSQLSQHSLGWVSARHSGKLVGFVNVAWDGGKHAFILDTMVAPACQRRGLARAMVQVATEKSRQAGCEWLHVDFEPQLRPFYYEACGFRPADAGVLSLR